MVGGKLFVSQMGMIGAEMSTEDTRGMDTLVVSRTEGALGSLDADAP